MSWIERRPYAALAAFALFLRVAAGLVTEFAPIFPAYYYTDANLIHGDAVSVLADARAGRAPVYRGSLSERVQTLISVGAYSLFGPRPLVVKLLNALLGSAAVCAFVWALAESFPPAAAFAGGIALAAWPSHVFYTSQNLKEAPVALLSYAALGCALRASSDEGGPARSSAFAAAAALLLTAAGLYRSYVLVALAGALAAALAARALRPPRAAALGTASLLALVVAVYPSLSHAVMDRFNGPASSATDRSRQVPPMIPVTYDGLNPEKVYKPTSPEGITSFRRTRQEGDQHWAKLQAGREIGTQIYPDAVFSSWLDVALFLPKGAFAALFMPLPLLYPLARNIGRWAAAAENVVLLGGFVLAARGLFRGTIWPRRIAPVLFFAAMTVGAAYLEFDLGSAGRHKLLFLPMLFPFAAEELLRARRPA